MDEENFLNIRIPKAITSPLAASHWAISW